MEKKLRQKLEDGVFKNVSKQRSKTMGRIRSRGNKSTENKIRYSLVSAGVRGWKLYQKDIPGRPDIYFPDRKIAVFLDGCFWHGCPKCGHIPKTRTEFWKEKIRRNKARDKKTSNELRKKGIQVVRIWEHEIKDDLSGCILRLK